jgi:hypothetical protein
MVRSYLIDIGFSISLRTNLGFDHFFFQQIKTGNSVARIFLRFLYQPYSQPTNFRCRLGQFKSSLNISNLGSNSGHHVWVCFVTI